jgi:site-specific DNA recombinase
MNHSTHIGVSATRQKRVAFYLRVSSEEQAKNGFGLDAQKDSLTKYLKSREADGWTCDFSRHLFIDDGYSGSLESRPAFDRMKKVIER